MWPGLREISLSNKKSSQKVIKSFLKVTRRMPREASLVFGAKFLKLVLFTSLCRDKEIDLLVDK